MYCRPSSVLLGVVFVHVGVGAEYVFSEMTCLIFSNLAQEHHFKKTKKIILCR